MKKVIIVDNVLITRGFYKDLGEEKESEVAPESDEN